MAPLNASILVYPHITLLDHLAPIASFLHVPLIVFDEEAEKKSRLFYPEVQTIQEENFEEALPSYFQEKEALFHSMLSWSHHAKILRKLYNSQTRIIYVPHGNSDKRLGMHDVALEHDILLCYGQHMLDLFLEKKRKNLPTLFSTGDLRGSYYLKSQERLDKLVKLPFSSSKKTALFAPTWNDSEAPFTVFEDIKFLIQELSDEFNLLIKLHPLIEENHPVEHFLLSQEIAKHQSVYLWKEFAPIHPLLQKVDFLITDGRSSLAYDFLFFNKPLFLFKPSSNTLLKKVGIKLPTKEIAEFIERNLEKISFDQAQKELYGYCFHPISMDSSDPFIERLELLKSREH